MATNRSGSRRGLIVGLVIVLVLALGVGAYFVFFNKDSEPDVAEGTTSSEANPNANGVIDPIVVAKPAQIAPLSPKPEVPTPAGVDALINPLLGNFSPVSKLSIRIVDAESGTLLKEQDSGLSVVPASTAKLLTGVAVLNSLDPQARLTTQVLQGDAPGTVILKGGGDITLKSSSQVDTLYQGAASMTDIATQIKDKGVTPTKIITDTTRWADDPMAPGWIPSDIGTATNGAGYLTNLVPLMVDGDRIKANQQYSGRTGTPAETAAKALATALGDPNIEIEAGGTAPEGATVLASVDSQPIAVLLADALVNSDNMLAEALAREVALKEGAPTTFAGATSAILLKLQQAGIDTTGVALSDASGLSTEDRLTPKILADVLNLAVKSDGNLRDLVLGLPVAGATGTLASRFQQDQPSAPGRGWLRAKTGTLEAFQNITYALAGVVPDVDGRMLVFSIVLTNARDAGDRVLMDQMAASLRTCGCVA